MLRLFAMAAALVLAWTTLDLRPVHAAVAVDGGVPRTARAVRAAIAKRGLDGHVWLGKLRGVGGRRDTLIYVPRDLDTSRTIEIVVYMEGHGSFADDAMDHRHAASIARVSGNRVYVAPDAPSSAHGERTARTPYWQAGCAETRCAGGHSAPGDFIVFLAEVRAHIANVTGAERLDVAVSLIGFSNGGKGVVNALAQLADQRVRLADVIFADGNYATTALDDAWRILADRPEAPRLTVVVATGNNNHRRAAAFLKKVTNAPRIRVIALRAGHHAIGDAAVDYLAAQARDVAFAVP